MCCHRFFLSHICKLVTATFFVFLTRALYSEKNPALQLHSQWFYFFRHCLRFLRENVLLKRLHKYNKKKQYWIYLFSCIAPKQLLSNLWWECGNQTRWVMNNSRKWIFAECIIITSIQNFIDCPLSTDFLMNWSLKII